MLSNDPKLNELARKAMAAFDALTPEEQRAHRFEQRVSWVYGQVALSGSKATKEQIRQQLLDMQERGEI